MRRTLVWLWTTLVIPGASAAGQTWSSDGAPRNYALARQASYVPLETMRAGEARMPAVLTRRVSLHRESVVLQQALLDIANQAGLGLSYGEDLVRSHTVVSLDVANARAADALAAVVEGTEWAVLVTAAGQVTVVPAKQVARGTIAGRVTEAKTGQPIAGATVAIAGTRWRATTGEDGRFRLEDVAAGTYTLTVRRIGYVTSSVSVTVTADREATADVGLEVSVTPLDAVVVTGTVSATEVKELSSPISLVTAADIERRGITKINDLFRGEIPGLFTADYGAKSAQQGAPVYVRGSTELFDTPALKTYIDGIELANSQFLNEIDPTMIDHIEIVRGPEASTLYGAQAINGVMQIFTKKGHLGTAPHVVASLGVGSLEGPFGSAVRHQDNVSVTGGTASLSYSVGTSYQHDGAWTRDHRLDAYSGYGSLSLQPSGSPLRLDLMARLGQQNSWTGGGETTARAIMDGTLRLVPKLLGVQPERFSLPQRTVGLSLHYTPTSTWQHTLTVGVDRGASGQTVTQFPFFETPDDTLRIVTSSTTGRTTAAYNSALDVRLADRVAANVVAGADYWYFTYNTSTDNPNLTPFKGQHDHNTGLFSQLRIGFADALFLTTGVRVDHGPDLPDDRHHRSVNPRVGLSYVFGVGALRAKLRGGYGSALKPASPDFKEAKTFSPSYVQLAAPNLLPERQTGWDGGVELYAGDRASLSVTHYDQLARDLIFFYFPAFSPVFEQQFVNVARVKNHGWELEGTLHLTAGVSAKATYSQVESTVDSLAPNDMTGFTVGQDLPGVPHHTGALSLTGTTARLSLQAEFTYVGSSVNYNTDLGQSYLRIGTPGGGLMVTLPAAYRLGVRAGYDVTPHLSLYARCENLTNRVVLDQSYYLLDQIGRTTLFGVQLR
jgi:outer membrane receptor protein involved in Fe transport